MAVNKSNGVDSDFRVYFPNTHTNSSLSDIRCYGWGICGFRIQRNISPGDLSADHVNVDASRVRRRAACICALVFLAHGQPRASKAANKAIESLLVQSVLENGAASF